MAFGLQAKEVLASFDFSQEDWTLIGLPVHNYKKLPIQTDLGAFMISDKEVLNQIKSLWNLTTTYDDKCDYHYTLKLYRGNTLVESIGLNLHCGYLTLDGLSYAFERKHFDIFIHQAKPIDWSRITFSKADRMRKAIKTLSKQSDVYWYEDVTPYLYPGYFGISVGNLAWNVELDSLDSVIKAKLASESNSQAFYVKRHFEGYYNGRKYVRYLVNCAEEFSFHFPPERTLLNWRSHFQQADSIRLVAMGVDEKKYRKIMTNE